MSEQAIALKVLIRQRHMTYEAFCREWDRVARSVDQALKGRYPGRAQYYRWLRGDLTNKRPFPDACRMLEAMFPGWSVDRLFLPAGEVTQLPDAQASAETVLPQAEVSMLAQEHLRPVPSDVMGTPSATTDLTGEWWASWQTFRDGVEKIATQQVECKQSHELIRIATITHGLSVEEGGYHWSGELRLWDNEILMGWYAATEGPVRSKGTMYFAIHPHGLHMAGRWVGLGYDGRIMTGWASMAKTHDSAEVVIDRLNHGQGEVNL